MTSDYGFTQQEKRLLRYIAQGTHEKEMADTLKISIHTVHNHLTNIYHKLNVHSKAEAAVKIFKENLLNF